MGVAQNNTHALFSLRLEQGVGRLVLADRPISDFLVVEEMCLDLEEVPSHLDMTAGVEGFRHQRGHLQSLIVHVDDQDIGRLLRRRCEDLPLKNLEVLTGAMNHFDLVDVRKQLAEGLEIIESQWIHQKRLIPPAQLQ